LSRQIVDQALVSVQNPIKLNNYTEPQPAIAVLRPREDFYAQALSVPEDVLLVVEVAEMSLEYDRDEKIPRYAQTRIPEVWLSEVKQAAVTPYTYPDSTRSRRVQILARGQPLSTDTLGDFSQCISLRLGWGGEARRIAPCLACPFHPHPRPPPSRGRAWKRENLSRKSP
jgi:hypothetical protein